MDIGSLFLGAKQEDTKKKGDNLVKQTGWLLLLIGFAECLSHKGNELDSKLLVVELFKK